MKKKKNKPNNYYLINKDYFSLLKIKIQYRKQKKNTNMSSIIFKEMNLKLKFRKQKTQYNRTQRRTI